jgi:hypothetical protein
VGPSTLNPGTGSNLSALDIVADANENPSVRAYLMSVTDPVKVFSIAVTDIDPDVAVNTPDS